MELAWSLEGLSGVALDARPERAVRLAGAAAAVREAIASQPYPWERERLDRWLEAAVRNLAQAAYTAAWAEGRAMPLEKALALEGAEDGADETLQAPGVPEHSTHDLSPREREVIRLVAGGRTNRQIAEHLVIAPRTADTHVGNILTKLDLHSRAELAVWAVEHGLTTSRPG